MARRSSENGDKTEQETEVSTEATTTEDAATASDGAETGPDATDTEMRKTEEDETPEVSSAYTLETEAKESAAEDGSEAKADETSSDGSDEPSGDARAETDATADTDTDTDARSSEIEDAVEVEAQSEDAGESAQASTTDTAPEAPTAPPPQTVVERRGPGFVPLVLGGIVAAGLGYFASVAELVPGLGDRGPSPEIQAALNQQADALSTLQAQVAALGEAGGPDVDLGPVTDEIAGLAAQLDDTAGAIAALTDRVVTLEERPVFSGDITADAAEAAEAVAAMEEQMRQREEEAAARAAEAEAAAQAARDAAAAAQAEAEAAMARAEAEAALTALRLAVTRGDPFAEPLAAVAAIAEVPAELSDAADSGVPSLEALQDSFPAAARAALPVALRETAGDSPVDRFAAFVQGQVGGRAVAPREGDSVDAILSRAQGAVTAGDLDTALAEIATLPEGAQAVLADWTAEARTRSDVLSALQIVTQALAGAN